MTWTKPHYGVQHWDGPLPPAIKQATVVAYSSSFAEAYLLTKGGGFTPFVEVTMYGDDAAEKARRRAETWLAAWTKDGTIGRGKDG